MNSAEAYIQMWERASGNEIKANTSAVTNASAKETTTSK